MEQPRILCVDDDEISLRVCSLVLTPHYQVDTTYSGLDAISLCQSRQFAAILMDIRLPGLNGFAVAAQIRTSALNKQTPIIGITACGWQYWLKDNEQTCFCQLLDKPLEVEKLMAIVDSVVLRWSNNSNS